jgi:phosphoenolpyruvate synthase/pyruvate phosphate dikinase
VNYISRLTYDLPPEKTGNKARSLIFLDRNKFRIPLTYVLSADAFQEYKLEGAAVIKKLKEEISNLPQKTYAIRSSTCAEDSEKYSFAGQFQTITDVSGEDNILKAVQSVWESANSPDRKEYDARIVCPEKDLRCAVIIQEMVNSQLAGVSFSKNPVTGLYETIIESVEGQGANLVQSGVTPQRWRFKKERIIEGNDHSPFIKIIRKISLDTLLIKKKYGHDVDIEWAYDGKDIYYLQVRRITGSGNLNIYSNKLAQEMLPGQIKPLVWSVNIPLVNGTWITLLSEITGQLDIKPEDLSRTFYYRFYLNMTALDRVFKEFGLPAESLESMMGKRNKEEKASYKPGLRIFRHTFRIIRFFLSKLHFEKTIKREYERLSASYESIALKIRQDFTIGNFHTLYLELFREGQKIAYLNIIVPLLMRMYNNKLSKKLAAAGANYNQLDFEQDFPLLSSLSPLSEMELIKPGLEKLSPEMRLKSPLLESFLKKYGHLSESGTDFSSPKWEEDPDFALKMILSYEPVVSKSKKYRFSDLKYSAFRYPGLKSLYMKSGRFKLYREQISSLYIFGYGQFRTLFLRLGEEFCKKGFIEKRDDIFYLSLKELENAMGNEKQENTSDYTEMARSRKKEIEETRDLILPSVIIGEDAPLLPLENARNLQGIGTSPGIFSGKTTLVRGTVDFQSVENGDVLLIPFSDVSWTPVLARAGAIVSESGGMLSHCSIIARELGIPALVSVENACALGSDLRVTVDGSNGILTVQDND